MVRSAVNDRIPKELADQAEIVREILERELKRDVKKIEAYRALTGIIKRNFKKDIKKCKI